MTQDHTVETDSGKALTLWDTSNRQYVRISELANCYLKTAYRMRMPGMFDDTINLRMGTALEPMIVEWLRDHGVGTLYTGERQLEVQYFDLNDTVQWHAVGHPDGICLGDSFNPDRWTEYNIPRSVQNLLGSGRDTLLEIKTMNLQSWMSLRNHGLWQGGGFLTKYYIQVQMYMHAIRHGYVYEAIQEQVPEDAQPITTWSGEHARDSDQLIDTCLLVGLCTENKKFAFDVITYDEDFCWSVVQATANDLIKPLQVHDTLPDPSYPLADDFECYRCSVAHLCPAAIAKREGLKDETVADSFLDASNVPIEAPGGSTIDTVRLDELCEEYDDLRRQEKEIEARKNGLKEQIKHELQGTDDSLYTVQYKVKLSPTKGRRTLDQEELKNLAQQHGFELPYKTGAASERLYVSPLYGPNVDL